MPNYDYEMTDCTCKTCSDYNDSQSYGTADRLAKCNPAPLYLSLIHI